MNTFSLPDVYNAAAQYKGQQSRNAFLEQQSGLVQQQMQRQNALAQREAQYNPLYQQYLQGGDVQNQLLALDPERAQRDIEFQNTQNELAQQQQRAEAEKIYKYAQYVQNSKSPSKLLTTAFPEYVDQLAEQGVDVENLDDDRVKSLAAGLMEYYGPLAGVEPEGQYEPVLDSDGNIVGQRNPETGKVETDPRTEKPTERDAFGDSSKLRNEFIKGSGDYITVRDAYNRIEASATDPSAAGDLALIFNYMKVLDPGSTIREGEFATAEQSTGVPARIRNQYNKLLTGERLTVEQRDDFVDRAGKLYSKQEGSHKKYVNEYTRLAKQNGLDPSNVIVDFSVDEEPAFNEGQTATNPQTGEKIIFKGGQWVSQ